MYTPSHQHDTPHDRKALLNSHAGTFFKLGASVLVSSFPTIMYFFATLSGFQNISGKYSDSSFNCVWTWPPLGEIQFGTWIRMLLPPEKIFKNYE
jgi:hypothetical protein